MLCNWCLSCKHACHGISMSLTTEPDCYAPFEDPIDDFDYRYVDSTGCPITLDTDDFYYPILWDRD